jgi:polar amino acid transport system substrate-binding protein
MLKTRLIRKNRFLYMKIIVFRTKQSMESILPKKKKIGGCMKNFICAVLFLFLAMNQIVMAETATISVADSPLSKIVFEDKVKPAYAEIGITVDAKIVPAQRALQMSNSGKTLAENMRMAGIEKKFPNLIMVPTPVHTINWMIVTKDKKFTVDGAESIKPYKVGFVRGIKFTENITKGLNADPSPSYSIVLKKVNSGRNDIGIVPAETLKDLLKDPAFSSLSMLEPPLESIKLYHYVYKDKKDLIPQLDNIFKKTQ